MIAIGLLAVGALLLMGSIGAFFLYVPFLSIAVVVVILLGMALTFSIGFLTGDARVLRLRSIKQRSMPEGIAPGLAHAPSEDLSASPLPLTAPLDE